VISVRDQGVGIAPEEQVRVFERFYQVTSVPGEKPVGAGLGLAICRRIVEAHGGCIWMESAPGEREALSNSPCHWWRKRTTTRANEGKEV